ncbi:MAG: bifunctional deaminase-reductase domain-containing protein [Acidobacteria bacterium OLB17]|nr:MAG: bifunctional deaminase-reductase domain-containing protein [Acidobacteria bacterium OLB17]
MTLDGVIQNEENDGDGFKWGGWFFPFADEVTGAVVQERLGREVDLLLGRRTFESWEGYWPTHSNFWPNINTITKYVASNTRTSSDWKPSVFLSGDLVEKVRELKQTDGPDLHAFGSANMLQTLFKADLVDSLELMIIPVTLGQGKRLFQDGTIPAAFKVTSSQIAPKGIICVTYERDGEVKTASPQIEEDE